MQTKVKMEDAVVVPTKNFSEFFFKHSYWTDICKTCKYDFMENEDRCNDCKPRVLPPTRWRKNDK